MAVALREITDANREAVLALRVAAGQRLGFVPTGELDPEGEVIMRLALPWTQVDNPPST